MLQVCIGNNYKRKRMYVYRGVNITKFSSIMLPFFLLIIGCLSVFVVA